MRASSHTPQTSGFQYAAKLLRVQINFCYGRDPGGHAMAKRPKHDNPRGLEAAATFALHAAPGHLLRRCQQIAIELYMQEVGADGPTPRQFAVLLTVGQKPGLNQIDLVRLTGIDRSTIAEMVGRLIERNLLRRQRTKRDQRSNELHLTPAGAALVAAALPGVRRAQARIMAPLPPATRATFIRALQTLASAEAVQE
jgi:DNA-binding MarR family transcriptional regulator